MKTGVFRNLEKLFYLNKIEFMEVPLAGDIFSFPVKEDEYGFGRIMLNIQTQCIEKKLLSVGNPLEVFSNTILVEIYRETSVGELPEKLTVLIPGILTSDSFIKNGQWKKIDFLEVNPKEVEFPEGLSSEKTVKGALIRGELRLLFDIEYDRIEKIGISPGTKACRIFGELVLFQLGRKDEIDNPRLVDKELRNLANHDLRFSEYRDEIYNRLNLDPNESYYNLALRMGFDLARFY